MKTFALVAMTGDQVADWHISSLACGPFMLDAGSEFYTKGLAPQGIPMVFEGEDCIKLLSRFDRVVLWHWPHEDILYAIRNASGARQTKIGLACAFEAVPQIGYWSSVLAPIAAVQNKFLLTGTDGQPVDAYANLPGAPGKPHLWYCDVANQAYGAAYLKTMETVLYDHYAAAMPNFLFIDSVLRRPFYGAAPNAPEITAARVGAYTWAYRKFLESTSRRLLPVWGNTDGPAPEYAYSLDGQFWEHALNHGEQSKSIAGGCKVALGYEEYPLTPTSWSGVQTINEVYALCARTGTAYALTHPNGAS